jgi:hypothetical protein
MYKRRRTVSDMEDSQESSTTPLTTPASSQDSVLNNTDYPTTSTNSSTNTPNNSDNSSISQSQSLDNSSDETLVEKFNTARFINDDQSPIEPNPSVEALYRTLRNLKGKTIQCQHHINNMETHIMNGTAPRGLQSNIQPNVPSIDITLIRKWEATKLEYQSKLLICLRDYWIRHHENLLQKCNKLEEELKSSTTEETWNKMQKQIDTIMKATRDNLNKPRRQNNQRRNAGGSSKERSGRN